MFRPRFSRNPVRRSLTYPLLAILGLVLSPLLGASSRAQQSAPAVADATKSPSADTAQHPPSSGISSDTPVVTILGLCDHPPAGRANDNDKDKDQNKDDDQKPDPNCKTVITRAEFELLINTVQPNMAPRAREEFASTYVEALVKAKKAEEMGLDKGAKFEEQMRVARIQILAQDLTNAVQAEASHVSDADIEAYYRQNTPQFEEAELQRIYVPKAQDPSASSAVNSSEADRQKQAEQGKQFMKQLAEKLQARAVGGEDFANLQAEAYKAAGIKAVSNPSLGKVRRASLPRSQVGALDLKPGEVSSVIEDSNGYFIYKVQTKRTPTLEQVRDEITTLVRSQHILDAMHEIEESATSTLNESYFSSLRKSRKPASPSGSQ